MQHCVRRILCHVFLVFMAIEWIVDQQLALQWVHNNVRHSPKFPSFLLIFFCRSINLVAIQIKSRFGASQQVYGYATLTTLFKSTIILNSGFSQVLDLCTNIS